MGKYDKLLDRLLRGGADSAIPFDELRRLLSHLGFEERVRGDHHLFRRGGIREMINLQRDGEHAKSYQVRQVRSVLTRYGLAAEPMHTGEEE